MQMALVANLYPKDCNSIETFRKLMLLLLLSYANKSLVFVVTNWISPLELVSLAAA